MNKNIGQKVNNKKIKILHIALCSPYNLNWNYQENMLANHHDKLGFDVTVITTQFITNKTKFNQELHLKNIEYENNSIKIIRLQNRISIIRIKHPKFRFYSTLYSHLINITPDIIFIHGIQFFNNRTIIKYYKLFFPKIFIDSHEDYNNSAQNFFSKKILHGMYWRYYAKKYEKIVEKIWGVLPARVDFYRSVYKINSDKLDVLFLGADDELVLKNSLNKNRLINRKKYSFDSKKINIVSGGKIDKNKTQLLTFMEAFNFYNNDNLVLYIFGSINEDYKLRFSELISDKIIYLGWLNLIETYEIISISDIVVFPGLHSTLWEQTVAQKKPIIVKKIPGFDHLNINNNCDYFYEDSVKHYLEKLTLITENKNYLSKLKFNAEMSKSEIFLYSKIAKKSINYEKNFKDKT